MKLKNYQSTLSELLESALISLCCESLPSNIAIEIDGLICVGLTDIDEQIVVKIHKIIGPQSHAKKKKHLNSCHGNVAEVESVVMNESEGRNDGEHKITQCDNDVEKSLKHEQLNLSNDDDGDSEEIKNCAFSICCPTKKHINISGLDLRINNEAPQNHKISNELQTCNLCYKRFSNLEEYNKHVTKYHNLYSCHKCPKLFTATSNLKRHLKLHMGIKQHKCQICHAAFARNYYLTKHMKKHKGIRVCLEGVCKNEDVSSDGRYDNSVQVALNLQNIKIENDYWNNESESLNLTSTKCDEDADGINCGDVKVDASTPSSLNNTNTNNNDDDNINNNNNNSDTTDDERICDVKYSDDTQEMKTENKLIHSFNKSNDSVNDDKSNGGDDDHGGDDNDDHGGDDLTFKMIKGNHLAIVRKSNLTMKSILKRKFDDNDDACNTDKKKCIGKNCNDLATQKSCENADNECHDNRTYCNGNTDNDPNQSTKQTKPSSSSSPPSPTSSSLLSPPFRCCTVNWLSFPEYETHCFDVHNRFPCEHCTQTFTCKNNKRRHFNCYHGNKKEIHCGVCMKTFSRTDIMKEHRLTHTKSYMENKCRVCNYFCNKKAILINHLKKCFKINNANFLNF